MTSANLRWVARRISRTSAQTVLRLLLIAALLVPAAAWAQETIDAQIDALHADTIRTSKDMLEGKISLEEADARMTRNMEREAELLRQKHQPDIATENLSPDSTQPGELAQTALLEFASQLRLDGRGDALEGSEVRLQNVPLFFQERVLLETQREVVELVAVPDTNALAFDPVELTASWVVRLPMGITGSSNLKFEGLAHPALKLEIKPLPPVVGALDDRFTALETRLRSDLEELGWRAEDAVAALQSNPRALPEEVSALATFFFMMLSHENPINLGVLMNIDRAFSTDPVALMDQQIRLFDSHLPPSLLSRRADTTPLFPRMLRRAGSAAPFRVWRAATGASQVSFEQMLSMIEEGDAKTTFKKGIDGITSGSSLTGAGSVLLGGPGSLIADLALSLISGKLRDDLHKLPRNLKLDARFADRAPRTINDNSCMPLIVEATGISTPRVDLIYSQSGKSAELMAKLVFAFAEAALTRAAKTGNAIDWGKRLKQDAGTLADLSKIAGSSNNKKRIGLGAEDAIRAAEWLKKHRKAKSVLAAQRKKDWFKYGTKSPDPGYQYADALQVFNKVMKQELARLEQMGGPALTLRTTPAKTWGPYRLTPEQISKYVKLSGRDGPISVDKNGCIQTCWRGQQEPFSVEAVLTTDRGSLGYGYRKASSIALGEFAAATGRIALSNPSVAPGKSLEISLEIDGALPGRARFSVPGDSGFVAREAGMNGTFIAPESIQGCSQRIAVTAQLTQDDSMCAPAPLVVGHIEVRDPDAEVFMPPELVCRRGEKLPFSVSTPSGQAKCSVQGAGSVSGSDSAFVYSCSRKRAPAVVSCTDARGGLGNSCNPTMQIRYAKTPGITAAAGIGVKTSGVQNHAPSFSSSQLLRPRLPVLAAAEPPDGREASGGIVDANENEPYREPTAEAAAHYESVVAPVRAKQFALSRTAHFQARGYDANEQSKSTLRADFWHDNKTGLSVVATLSERVQASGKRIDVQRSVRNVRTWIDFVAFIPIDNGGPRTKVRTALNGSVSEGGGAITVTGYVDSEERNLARLEGLTDAVRIVPDTAAFRSIVAFEKGLLAGLPFNAGKHYLGHKNSVASFMLPATPKGTPRGLLVLLHDTPREDDTLRNRTNASRSQSAANGSEMSVNLQREATMRLTLEVLSSRRMRK